MTEGPPGTVPRASPYPGPASFQDRREDRLLFFGREKESDALLNLVLGASLTLLFSRSGLGKTSLVNAGLLHPLRERGYFPVMARLTHDPTGGPLPSVLECIRRSAERDGVTIGGNSPTSSFWEYFQSATFARSGVSVRPVLIFDQFEELFTVIRERGEAARRYRQSGGDPVRRQLLQREFANVAASLETAEDWEQRFARELADLVRRRVPEAIRSQAMRRLEDMDRNDPQRAPIVSLLYEGAVPDVKVVLSIREDYLPELQTLRAQIPDIFRNALRLEAFTVDQARRAIESPSQQKDVLGEDTFTFDLGVVDEMLNFLRMQRIGGRTVQGDTVEPVQLQIVCDDLNRRRQRKHAHAITMAALRAKGGMKRILQAYCRSVFRKLPVLRAGWSAQRFRPSFTNLILAHRPRAAARTMCEKGLITGSGHRNSLIVDEIKRRFGVPGHDLTRLVDERLLRMEPRLNNYFYELSHDTLIGPVRDNMRQRRRVRIMALSAVVLLPSVATNFLHLATVGVERAQTEPDLRRLRDTSLPGQVRSVALQRLVSRPYTLFNDMQLRLLSLPGLVAPYALFDGSDLTGTDLHDADLTRASFAEATLIRARFDSANLREATFRGAKLMKAHLRQADLTGATLRDAQLDSCDLTQAKLEHVDVTGVVLGRAILLQAAWWLAYGWTPRQIAVLQARWPPQAIVRSDAYRRGLQAWAARLEGSKDGGDSADAFNGRAWHRAVRGVELNDALADVQRSLSLAPGEYHALDTRGYILLQLGRVNEALSDFRASVAADTSIQADLYPGENVYHLALALELTADTVRADSSFAAAERFRYEPTYELVLTPRTTQRGTASTRAQRKVLTLPRLRRSP